MEERLQKIIAQAGIASRREAEKLINEGLVMVDGKVVTEQGLKVDVEKAKIVVNGKKISTAEKKVYFLLNKPKGYISTAKDERGRKTVLDLLSNVKERVFPIGRLDNNTEGLLLLTNDGELMNGLLHPRNEIEKTYVATIEGNFSKRKMIMLRQGIELEDGMTAPAKIRVLFADPLKGRTKIEITIHEGRNRQVRRMFDAVDCPVKLLKRTEFAHLTLTGVKRGEYRELSKTEISFLRSLAGILEK